MRNSSNIILLILIIILAAIALYVVVPGSPGLHISAGPIEIQSDFEIRQGLDLQGGVQVLLEADLEPGQELDPGALDVAAKIIENRVNALGVVEPLVQTQGDRRIIVELPGVGDPDQAIATIKETGLLEFVDAGDTFLPARRHRANDLPLARVGGSDDPACRTWRDRSAGKPHQPNPGDHGSRFCHGSHRRAPEICRGATRRADPASS